MKVNFKTTQNSDYNQYKNRQPAFSALIIKDAKYWNNKNLDRFVRNKEIQKLVTELDKQGKNVIVAKAQITGTTTNKIYIYLKEGLKKIAHINEDELFQFQAEESLKHLL